MDSNNSDIVILQDVLGKRSGKDLKDNSSSPQLNGVQMKEGLEDSCFGEDGLDEVPDFDDAELEVLDCWEEEEEIIKEKLPECEGKKSSSSRQHGIADTGPSTTVTTSKKYYRTSSCSSDKTVLLEDITRHSDAKKTDRSSRNDTSNRSRTYHKSTKRRSPPALDSSSKATESKKSSKKSNDKNDGSRSASRKSTKSYDKRPSKLPSDPTETKVDKFLKEIALQHPKIIGLQDDFDDKALEPVSSDSSKHSSQGLTPTSLLDPSDLPPGVDVGQVGEDASTSHLVVSSSKGKGVRHSQSLAQASPADVSSKDSSQKSRHGRSGDVSIGSSSKSQSSGHICSDMSKVSDGVKERRSRSPHSNYHFTNQTKRSSRSPPYKVRRVSPAKSFSISPSPSPRSNQPQRSPLLPNPFNSVVPAPLLPTPRIPALLDFNYSSSSAGPMYVDRHSYQPSLMDRNRYHRSRSPVREASLTRELSRSLSRERLHHNSWSRSRSRSRGKHTSQSRSRHHYSSKDEQHRRYRRSTSRSESPARRSRSRSRSRSWSPLQYLRKRSPLRDERGKRLNLPRSRSRSPWKSHTEISSNEWHRSQDLNRSLPVKDDVQLEHDMEQFIKTNMAATGLIPPPAPDVRGWLEQDIKAQESVPMKSLPVMAKPEVDLLQGGMPLPPPPPDISELMSGEEIKEANTLRAMSPEVSLSSLLESAVTGCPDKVIIERCQDAIMKLHDVSIKPGRFAVISSIKVPQTELSSTFRPWQSILNRSSFTKIQLNYSKSTEKPVLWETSDSKFKNQAKNLSSSHKETAPAAPLSINTSVATDPFNDATDRAVLLDRILALTKELYNVRQTLDRRTAHRRDTATQTRPVVTLCENCGKKLCLPLSKQGESSASSSSSGFWASASSIHPRQAPSKGSPGLFSRPTPKQLAISKQMPASKQVPAPKQTTVLKHVVPAPKQVPVPQPIPGLHPSLAPVPVPAPASLPISYFQPNNSTPSLPIIPQNNNNVSGTSTSFSNKPSCGSNLPATSFPLQHSSLTAPSVSLNSSSSKVGEPAVGNEPANEVIHQSAKIIPQASNTVPQPEKEIPPLLSLIPRHVPKKLSTPIPMTKGDFDISKYLMLGDEHMFDLIAHLRSIGIQVQLNNKFCSNGQTVDTINKNVIGEKLPKQIVLMLGLYNLNYNEKTIVKYKHLIGFFRNRCGHLVLIEPPPIPKWKSMKHAWKTFTELKESFGPFQADNVSVVFIGERLLLNPTTPNPAFYGENQRLNREGLCIVTEELLKAIAGARSKAWI